MVKIEYHINGYNYIVSGEIIDRNEKRIVLLVNDDMKLNIKVKNITKIESYDWEPDKNI